MFRKLFKKKTGFTLIEVIVGIAISGILGSGLITAMYQIGRINNMGNAKVTAVNHLENAFYYISRDVQMAQTVQIDGEDYWLKLSWINWDDNTQNEVTYNFDGGALSRSTYIGGDLISSKPIAQNISAHQAAPPNTETTPPEKAWTIELTTTTTSGHRQESETRQVKIIPRPGS